MSVQLVTTLNDKTVPIETVRAPFNAVITAFNGTGVADGSMFNFAGRDTVGDGGGGLLRFIAGSTLTANGGTVYEVPGGRLVRENVNISGVCPEWFGAKDGNAVATKAAFEAACVYCYQTGAPLVLQGKAYSGARVEVHGTFDVHGNGATVDYLGIGTTYIAGTGSGISAVPTPWPNDPSYDPTGLFNTVMYQLVASVNVGDQSITLSSVTGLESGDYLFLAGVPTSASSPNNYIPRDFEFVRVASIAGNVVTLTGRTTEAYSTAGAAFYSPGLAVNCNISGIRTSTSTDAYQYVVRSSYGCKIDGIELAGQSAAGASTFSDLLEYRGVKITGTYGPLSTARGTVSTSIDGVEWSARTGATGEDCSIFVEESFYKIDVRNVKGSGGYFSIRQLDMAGAARTRVITVNDSIFDTTNAANGATGPLQVGACAGCDQHYNNVIFSGAVVTPPSAQFPGISGSALTWMASNQSADVVRFSSCTFDALNPGSAFEKGSGFLGSVIFDDLCTFNVAALAAKYYRGGDWITFPAASPVTNSDANTAYAKRDVIVRLRGGVDLNSLASGGTLGILPVGYRPPIGQYFPVSCVGTGGAYFTVGQVAVSSSGVVSWQGSERAAVAVQLDNISFSTV